MSRDGSTDANSIAASLVAWNDGETRVGVQRVELGAAGRVRVQHLGIDLVDVHVLQPLVRVVRAGATRRLPRLLGRQAHRRRRRARLVLELLLRLALEDAPVLRHERALVRLVVLARQVPEDLLGLQLEVRVGGDDAFGHGVPLQDWPDMAANTASSDELRQSSSMPNDIGSQPCRIGPSSSRIAARIAAAASSAGVYWSRIALRPS